MGRFWFRERKKPVTPHIFISYGMTKCGSTLAFQLARVALIQAGFDQDVIHFPGTPEDQKINFVGRFTDDHLEMLEDELDRRGHPIVIKTHSRPSPTEVRLMESATARAHAVFRDPRDMALSLLDAGVAAREKGKAAFSEMKTLSDAKIGIDNQMDSLTAWLQLPGTQRLPYDRVAFDSVAAAADILDHLGIDGDPAAIVRQVTRQEFTQKNKALRDRHHAEMSPEESADFETRYAPFFTHVAGTHGAHPQLPPNTLLHNA